MREIHLARTPREVSDLFTTELARARAGVAFLEVVTDNCSAGAFRLTRFRDPDGRELVPDRSPFLSDGCPAHTGGLIADLVWGAEYVRRVELPPVSDTDPLADLLAGYRAAIVSPIYTAGRPEWIVLLARDPAALAPIRLDDVLQRANLVGAVVTAMTSAARLADAQHHIQQEVERIAEIQRSLLPPTPVTGTAGLEVAFRVDSYDRAGGDLVDFADLGPDGWAFLIADASGHGPSAAVVAAMLTAILRTFPDPGEPEYARATAASRASVATGGANPEHPGNRDRQGQGEVGDALVFANRHLCEKNIDCSFVTAVMGVWDARTRTLEYARAGHPLPMLRHADGTVTELSDAAGVPLGIIDDSTYPSARTSLAPGDLLLLYSDGIIEAKNSAGELFGTERLARALAQATSPNDALQRVTAAVQLFAANTPPDDDRTLLALQVQ